MSTRILRARWKSLSKGQCQAAQMAQLRGYLKRKVLPNSAYYRELFAGRKINVDSLRSVEDLGRIPFTSKEDLSPTEENPQKIREFVLIPDEHRLKKQPAVIVRALLTGRQRVKRKLSEEFRPIFMTGTTGRSADPVPFLYTAHDLSNLALAGERMMEVCETAEDFRIINMFPYAPHLAFWQAHYAATNYGVFCIGSGGGKVMGTEGNIRLLRKINPEAIIGMPTFIYHVLQQAVDEGDVRLPKLCRIVLGGEKVPDGMRRKLRLMAQQLGAGEVFILATYGFTEAKMAWTECPCPLGEEPSGYHLYPDMGLFEVVDPRTGEIQPEGHPGELVHTPLDSRGTVVLRYRTGDTIDGGLIYDPCPYCGRVMPRLLGHISRTSEFREMQLDKIKGTLVDFNQIEHVLEDCAEVGAWQLELRKLNDDPLELDELVLHVQKSRKADEEETRRKLTSLMQTKMELRPNRILFHSAKEMRTLQGVGRELKEMKLIDHRPEAGEKAGAGRRGFFRWAGKT